MVPTRVHVVDVEGTLAVDLPADARGRVDGVGLHEIVRNHGSQLSRPAGRDEAFQRPPIQHGSDIGIVAQERAVRYPHDAASCLIHRPELEPGSVPCDVDT